MSKQRKPAETKDGNTISSKLLGANLSDINIQKFRDLTQLDKGQYTLAGKISMPLLKNISNKFSASVIFTLTLPNQALTSIDPISDCQNLMVLNLRRNSIESIAPLQKLVRLRIVDISDNSITSIDALSASKELVSLHVEGNLVKSIEQLNAIKNCTNLKSLFLQSLSGATPNPLCALNSYRNNALDALPQLKRLDGAPSSLKEFSNGNELKEGKKREVKMEYKSVGPYYTAKFPTVGAYVVSAFPEESALKKSLAGCKSAVQELELKIKMMIM